MKEIDPLMTDLRMSLQTLRALAAFSLLATAAGGLSGCSGEEKPATTSENTAAVSTNPKDAKNAVLKSAGTVDKGNLMPDFPQTPKK